MDPADETPPLNQFATLNEFKFKYDSTDKKIYLSIQRGGKEIVLPMPEVSTIPENQMSPFDLHANN